MTPYSWKIVTTANTSFNMPFECPPVAIWNDTVGSAKTATVEGIWGGGALPLDSEIWVDLEYLGDAASPQASFVNDGTANLLAAPAAQAASSAAWVGLPTTATWGTGTAVTLSGGNLVVTNTGTSSADQGASVSAGVGATSGKYYMEMTFTTVTNGVNYGFGICTTTSTYTGMGNNGTVGVILFYNSGAIFASGSAVKNVGSGSGNYTVGIAVDLDLRKIWFRGPSGLWYGQAIGTENPVTSTGGVAVPAGGITPVCTFGGSFGALGNVVTANFGASAFAGAVPSGFTAGWPPATLPPSFKLSVLFTAAQPGWVYARVKCAKPSTTFYIDPYLMLAAYSDTTAPVITSSASVSVNEDAVLAHPLTVSGEEFGVTWSIVGGADAARLEISGSTLRWLSNGTKDFEAPDDADANNIYVVQVRATDISSNTTNQTVTVTVLDLVSTSYANTGGTGNRTAIITISTTVSAGTGAVANIIDGTSSNNYYWGGGQTTREVVFDFGVGASKVIDEFKWEQSGAGSQGTWRFEGSNDNSSYTTFPESIDLGGTANPVQTVPITNSTGYRYYRLRQTASTTNSGPYVREITFKIG